MLAFGRVLLVALALIVPTQAVAGPAEDAGALFTRWKAAYDANDNVAIGKLYATDAILHGTRNRDLTLGREAITRYFAGIVGTGHKVEFRDRELKALDDKTVLVVGFNDFLRHKDGTYTPEEARFTMLLVKEGNDWVVAHHHSSLRPPPKQ